MSKETNTIRQEMKVSCVWKYHAYGERRSYDMAIQTKMKTNKTKMTNDY